MGNRYGNRFDAFTDSRLLCMDFSGLMNLFQKLRLLNELRKLNKLIEKHIAMKSSWKTLLGGLLMSAAPVVAGMLPEQYHWVKDALLSIGSLILGMAAKDYNVSNSPHPMKESESVK